MVANVAKKLGVGAEEMVGQIPDWQGEGKMVKKVIGAVIGGRQSASARSRGAELVQVTAMKEGNLKAIRRRLDAASPTCLFAGCDRKWYPADSRAKIGGGDGWAKAGADGYGCTTVHANRARDLQYRRAQALRLRRRNASAVNR